MGLFSRKKKEKGTSHPTLTVSDIRPETSDSVSIAFNVPNDLKEKFSFVAGQYITLIIQINGEEVRRSYSICSSESEEVIRIGVKRVKGGIMSNYLPDTLKAGEEISVMPPEGNFKLSSGSGNFVAFVAGSGITPVLSQIKKANQAGGKFSVFYGNKSSEATMFKAELDELSGNHTINYYNTAKGDSRFTKEFISELLKENLDLLKADGFYLCGPQEMIENAKEVLKSFGVDEGKVHFELFVATVKEKPVKEKTSKKVDTCTAKIILDGEEFEVQIKSNADSILDHALDAGYDAPYSCKGAVCCTCRAKVVEGSVSMDSNFSLSDKEVEEGYILTCQSHPTSETLTIDYDQG